LTSNFDLNHFGDGNPTGASDMAQTHDDDQATREMAYRLWESEGRPEGKALDHWLRAEPEGEEEKIMAGRPDANLPALLTKDVPGG
jgi:DUF2934 family protein